MHSTTAGRSRESPVWLTASLALLAAVAGCGPPGAAPSAPGGGPPVSSSSAPDGTSSGATPSVAGAGLVAVIVMENHSPDQVLDQPYLASLGARGAVLPDYRAVSHPSLPNYLALTSGSTWGISDDGYHQLPAGHDLGAQLTAASVPWRAYMEGLTAGCLDSPYPYATKHNPFAYYGGACPPNVVPLTGLVTDLRSPAPPRFIWITPGLCNDDHDCSPAVGDRWLSTVVPMLLASPGFADHGLLAVVWDEGGNDSDHSTAVVLSPDVHAQATSTRYDHYAVLAAIEDRLRLSRLGAAAAADPLGAVLTPA